MPELNANPVATLGTIGDEVEAERSGDSSADSTVLTMTRGIAARDESAFRLFHERYFDRLYRLHLVAACGQEQVAQDALQETLLRVVRYARPFDSETVFWNWLRAVARSTARDGGRKRRRYLELLERFALHGATQPDPPFPSEDNTLEAALEEALAELEPPDRRLIEAKYLEGVTVRELAAQTGLTDKAVESRLLRLRQTLRERILKKLRRP